MDTPKPTSDKVPLHVEIADILRGNGNRWMTTQEIARLVARRGRYKKKDGTSNVTAFQVHVSNQELSETLREAREQRTTPRLMAGPTT